MKIASETLGVILNVSTFILQGSQKEKRMRVLAKIFEEIITENFLRWEKKKKTDT